MPVFAESHKKGNSSLVYLNNAATSWPKPREVISEVERCLDQPFAEAGRSAFCSAIDYPAATRELLAEFFHTKNPDHWVFTGNATESLNILIHGFAHREPARFHVVTTDLEHNSVLRPLYSLEQEKRLSYTIVHSGPDGHVDPEDILRAVRPDTRLVVMNHGSNVLGTVQDIQKVGQYLADKDIFFVVDGSQTAGLVPVDLSRISLDAYVFTGHKALFGMPGTGGFYISDAGRVAITRQGGTGSDSRNLTHPVKMPERFEAGTPNYTGIASLYAGIRFIKRTGLDVISAHNNKVTKYFTRELAGHRNIILYSASPDLPVIPFNIRGIPPDDVGYILSRAYGIITRTGLHCAPLIHERIDGGTGCIRLSPGYFTTLDECRESVLAIYEVADSADS
ncbi:MAG TPA: aminotransferase class V-fold PLP-dependent enzyme [Methanoregula sp.]|nr:aminotransferase class V-fold PLP-dependent enzyme [Methanoregula sp.]